MQVEIKGIDELFQKLDAFEKNHFLYAMARALTKTGQDDEAALVSEMRLVFNNPTPYTLNSLYLRPARKNDLSAFIYPKDDAGKGTPAKKFLYPEIQGGDRHIKRFERALQAMNILPEGMMCVPGAGAELDQYGNVSRGQLRQILSYLGAAEMTAGYFSNMTAKKRARLEKGSKTKRGFAYFVSNGRGLRASHLSMGIYKRTGFVWGTAIKPVLLFVSKVSYRSILHFFEVGMKVANERFPVNFREAMDAALRTARLK